MNQRYLEQQINRRQCEQNHNQHVLKKKVAQETKCLNIFQI